MTDIRIQPIVEGHGEVEAAPILLRRIWYQLGKQGIIDVLEPIRQPRTKLVNDQELAKYVEFAARKLGQRATDNLRPLILLILDADDDLPCELAPKLLAVAKHARPDFDIACVLVKHEYETWFAASAESLIEAGYLDAEVDVSETPEDDRRRKAWIKRNVRGTYS